MLEKLLKGNFLFRLCILIIFYFKIGETQGGSEEIKVRKTEKGFGIMNLFFPHSFSETGFPVIKRRFTIKLAEFRGKCFDVLVADSG